MSKILILPGWQDSGPQHWQSLWLKKYPNAVKVIQKDWMYPKREKWVKTLNDYFEKFPREEIVLVGHSLACATIGHWNNEYNHPIKGALLVGTSDMDAPNFPKEITGFAPMPLQKLKFPSILVYSENDPWVSRERAEYFAKCWGSKFVSIGNAGHINTDAGFGEWKKGEELLQELIGN